MSWQHVVGPVANRDLDGLILYYGSEATEEIARRFLRSFRSSVELLERFPRAGEEVRIGGRRVRIWPVKGFEDIRIYYDLPREGVVRVVRVLHGRREAGRALAPGE